MASSFGEAEQCLKDFLVECSKTVKEHPRVQCQGCKGSRSFYCADCCQVLLPRDSWPEDIQKLRLPFELDIILDDRRTSATGVQVASITSSCVPAVKPSVRLIHYGQGDEIPSYDDDHQTFLLFPSPQSVSLSVLLKSGFCLQRLVVLDCKWARPSVRLHPNIAGLQCVHLDNPPLESYYWRWHNAGEGMLSTVEALYFAAWEVATNLAWSLDERKTLVYLLWLFAIQREVIRRKYEVDGGQNLPPYLPFSEDGKEYQRNFRRQVEESHIQARRSLKNNRS